MNIVESLIQNNRKIGALSYLLNPKYVEECDDLSQLCAQLIDVKSYVELTSADYKYIVSKKVEIVLSDTIMNLSEGEIIRLSYQLLESPLETISLRNFFDSVLNIKPSVFIDNYLVAIVKVTKGEAISEQDYDAFDINQLRKLAEIAEDVDSFKVAQLLGDKIIERARKPFWEYHFVALQHNRLGNIEKAFENFNLFLDEAINKGVKGAIKTGYVRVIECCQQLNKTKNDIETLSKRIPEEIRNAAEVANALKELEDIEQFKNSLSKISKKTKIVGYYPLKSVDKLEDEINHYLELIEICPSYKSFYELFKCYSLIGNEYEALKYLELAQDYNYFLFNRYS